MGLRHWLTLAMTRGIGPVLARRIIDATGTPEAACAASANQLRLIEGIGTGKAACVHQDLRRAAEAAEQELARAARLGAAVLCPDDREYPPLLKLIPDPPTVLYVLGSLQARDLNAVAIVGSRRCSHYGREQSERFGGLLAGAGFTVVSGGARGVDSAAHRGAMNCAAGRTIAVLGCGVDVVYPPENSALFGQIARQGTILSEYPLGAPPLQENFPRRNRIISGMSRGVLVIEADERSGALITARQAADDHNRPVFALPGRVDNPQAAGPHALIRDGAVLVRNLEDIIDALDPLPPQVDEPDLFDPAPDAPPAAPSAPLAPVDIGLSDRQKIVLDQMDQDPVGVETLVQRTDLPAGVVLQELMFLTLKGRVQRVQGQSYVRRG